MGPGAWWGLRKCCYCFISARVIFENQNENPFGQGDRETRAGERVALGHGSAVAQDLKLIKGGQVARETGTESPGGSYMCWCSPCKPAGESSPESSSLPILWLRKLRLPEVQPARARI